MPRGSTGYLRAYVMPKVAEVAGFTGVLDDDQEKAKAQLQEFISENTEARQKIEAYREAHKAEYIEKVKMVYAYGIFDENSPADKKYEIKSTEELGKGYDSFLKDDDHYKAISTTINTLRIADLVIERAEALNSKAVADKILKGEKIDPKETLVSGAELLKQLGPTDPNTDRGGEFSREQRTSINLFRGFAEVEGENLFMFRTALAADYDAMLRETDEIKNNTMDMMLGADKKAQKEFLKGMTMVDRYTEGDLNNLEKTDLLEYAAELSRKISFKKDGGVKVK